MKIQRGTHTVIDTRELFTEALSRVAQAALWESSRDETKLSSVEKAMDLLENNLGILDLNDLTENQLIDLGFRPYKYNNLVTIWLVPMYLSNVLDKAPQTELIDTQGVHFQRGHRTIYPELSEDGLHFEFGVLAKPSDEPVDNVQVQCPDCGNRFWTLHDLSD